MILSALLALFLGACGEKQPVDGGNEVILLVSPRSADIAALGEQKTFSVTSSTDWLARSSASWLKVVTASGKGGTTASQLVVNVEENKTTAERTAELTVSNLGKESVTVAVKQAPGVPGGSGVRGIATADDLVAFARAACGNGSITPYLVDGVVKILNDIDCSSITEWIPAGSETLPLTYSIDGNGRTLKNVKWTVDVTKYPHAGLVGYARGITISRLTFGQEGDEVTFSGNSSGKVRAGGIVGYGQGVTLTKVTNNASLTVTGTGASGNNLIIGGIAGYLDSGSTVGGDLASSKGCVNNGDVTVPVAAQAGGLVGYNSGIIKNCTHSGRVTALTEGSYGPGWLCSYNKTMANVVSNTGTGYVGDAPDAIRNAMMNGQEGYDIENNSVDWTKDGYYDWEEVETWQLHSGAIYHHYSCTNVPREVRVVEVDLNDPGIEITSAFAGDMVPNPNGNKNSNNGKNLRELLSELCVRKRSEGQKILAGINCCFFDSNDGFSRGIHVEEGRPVFVNNPTVANALQNHRWGFTVFEDRTASCGTKKFSGQFRAGGKEFSYYSINDTLLRHTSEKYQASLYTSHYVRQPYPSKPSLINDLASDALYVVCEYIADPMLVNKGYAAARVVDIKDGRSTPLATRPYLTSKNRVGIALSGDMASELMAFIKVGDTVELRCDIAIDGDASKPILTLDSTMFQLMTDGKDASDTPNAGSTLFTNYDPKTYPVVSADRRKVWLVEVDGRQISPTWYSLGVKGYEMYRIAAKLGGAWVTVMDGGGSSAMWVWNQAKGSGSIVNRPSDSKGERSCMTYVLVREKQ